MNASLWDLPASLRLERRDSVAVLTLSRAHKRNALDDETILGLGRFFAELPAWAKVVVLAADGDHFSAGLDLGELSECDAVEGMHHSRMWHQAFARIQSGSVPVIAVLKGAVVGGGLELASSAHLRVAEGTTFFALPEGQRGLFVGGGASVRVSRLIGVQRMTDMMLTGRVLGAEDGVAAGLADYLVGPGEGLDHALSMAETIASNSPVSNYAILHALPRIAETDSETGFLLESLMAAVAQSSAEAKQCMADFLVGRAAKVAAAPTTPEKVS